MSDDMNGGPMGGASDDDKLWALIGWVLPLIAIVALLMEDKKERPFIRFHAINSLAFSVVFVIISTILGFVTFGLASCILPFLWIYPIYLGYRAYQGELFKVPVVTDFCKNQGWF